MAAQAQKPAKKAKKQLSDGGVSLSRLRKDIADGTPAPLYLFWGEELYLRAHYLSQLTALLAPDEGATVLEGKACTPDALSDALSSYSMFSQTKLVVVRDYDIANPDAAMLKSAPELISSIPDGTCCVFICGDSAPLSGKVNKKMEPALSEHAVCIEFGRQSNTALIQWAVRRCAARGKRLGESEAMALISLGDGLMYQILPELEKAAAYAAGSAVTRADIDAVCSRLTESVFYSVTDAVSARNFPLASARLSEMYTQGMTGIVAVQGIGRTMRQLYAASLVADRGLGTGELMKLAKMNSPYAADKVMTAARRFRTESLRKCVVLCCEAEQTLLRAKMTDRAALDLLLSDLCGA